MHRHDECACTLTAVYIMQHTGDGRGQMHTYACVHARMRTYAHANLFYLLIISNGDDLHVKSHLGVWRALVFNTSGCVSEKCILVWLLVRASPSAHTHTHTYTHTCTYTRAHTHTHTRVQPNKHTPKRWSPSCRRKPH